MSTPSEVSQPGVSKMPKLVSFIVFWYAKDKELDPWITEHLQYIKLLEEKGKLFASGPLSTRKGPNGVTVLLVKDEDEARAIAENEPIVKAGVRDFAVEPWFIHEGAFSLQVCMSDDSAQAS
ncbi:YciI family protein [Bradyrhizobium sp. NP1]|uniref:YciI family protein n=1 Tax=Bradyrhizobium sp. NP1 TaxID=3049772 RepID=UPI0025A4D422|nr:YciI family protein [Bradyrhizobium sp. NP1]WJR76868.1 YciI family protein [Bradyrhizobium sp. NP1]